MFRLFLFLQLGSILTFITPLPTKLVLQNSSTTERNTFTTNNYSYSRLTFIPFTTQPSVFNITLKNDSSERTFNSNEERREIEKRLQLKIERFENDSIGFELERKVRSFEEEDKPADVIQYIDEDPEVKELILKHYTMFDEDYFYPSWTYDGFFSPDLWPEIDIDFFTYNDQFYTMEEIKRRKSFMHLCSEKVLEVIDKPTEEEKQAHCYEHMYNMCLTNMPSPINILSQEAEENFNYGPFAFKHFDDFYAFRMFLPPDGTDILTVRFWTPAVVAALGGNDLSMPQIMKGPLGHSSELYLDRILFHVGSDRLSGSEHRIDGVAYGMEIQLFFTPEKMHYWESLAQYVFMDKDDPETSVGKNVHVLSVLVNVAKAGEKAPPDPDATFVKNFDILASAAEMFWRAKNREWKRAVQYTGRILSLEDFLKVPTSGRYYTYEGSLTHPPCLEHVGWSVFEKPIWITFEQWTKFSFIHSEYSDKRYLAGNFRPLEYIKVEVDLDTYKQMRKVQGEGDIEQKDIELGIEVAGSKSHLMFEAKYHSYELYYSQKVQKSRLEEDKGKEELDYYEDEEGNSKSRLVASVWTPLGLVVLLLLVL